MQVSSKLKCPWCDYQYSQDTTTLTKPKGRITLICPQCTNTFHVGVSVHGNFNISNNCEENDLRHNWKYVKVPGYDLWKKCRRCGKEDKRPTQLKLPGMPVETT